MNETILIQGDTGKVMFTGVDITKLVDLSSVPNKILTSQILQQNSWGVLPVNSYEIEVDFK